MGTTIALRTGQGGGGVDLVMADKGSDSKHQADNRQAQNLSGEGLDH